MKHHNKIIAGAAGLLATGSVWALLAGSPKSAGFQAAATVDVAPGLAALPPQLQRRREQSLRTFLAEHGATDKSVQDAIITHLSERQESRRRVFEANRKLLAALEIDNKQPASETQVSSLAKEYETALDAFNKHRKKAEAGLDANIGFSKSVRLRALLLALGAVGEAPPLLSMWNLAGTTASHAASVGSGSALKTASNPSRHSTSAAKPPLQRPEGNQGTDQKPR